MERLVRIGDPRGDFATDIRVEEQFDDGGGVEDDQRVSRSARTAAAAAYDFAHNRVVLFGGFSNTSILGDTWEYDGTNWIARNGGPAPATPARRLKCYSAPVVERHGVPPPCRRWVATPAVLPRPREETGRAPRRSTSSWRSARTSP